jgi:small subunit ribosomal protein S20
MANIKSSKKDIRRIARRTERNRQVRSRLKTLQKQAAAASQSDDANAAGEAARAYVSALEKASKSNVVHPNKVSRAKVRYGATLFAKAES